ncbi:GYD domain-containing protein [Luteibacter sp. OK325]|uniref:GYD domain-containing protein n=1 Tax=Luteibacter sp. OK325 TaxID=2135670 RepID=UPI000D373A3F|nr:GYD domain-containing protein [Luteibacter sp. OK325]PTR33979.1 GYD domain-containing protein [Luteibacter sp. OK325]
MLFYLTQWTYRDDQLKRFLTEPSDRAEVVRVAIEAFGGQLHSFFYCLGPYDGVAISSFPNQQQALACWMSLRSAERNTAIHNTLLIESGDGLSAMEFASSIVGQDG